MFLTTIVALSAYSMGQQQASPRSGSAAAPLVTATTPAAGAVIAPGPFTLSVTFDQPMMDQSFSFVRSPARAYPEDCEWPARLSTDRRTYSVRCIAARRARYEVWFNREPYMNFRSASGAAARPHQLLFNARK